MNLEPPSEHHVFVFFAAILVLLVVARLLGAVMQRFGQPSVIGELGAGVVLGPTVLGRVAPDVGDWLFPDDEVQTAMLFTVGWLGVVFLLVSTGAETDLGLIRRLGSTAAIVSVTSLVTPLVLGFFVGYWMPDALMADPEKRTIFALFIAAALGISSLPVMAKILAEMQLLRRDFAQLTLAAGMVNDVVGWVILGAVAGLAQAGEFELGALATTIGGVALFFVLAFTIGQRGLDLALREVRRRGNDPVAALGATLIFVLLLGVATQGLGVEAVLGAFVAGILIGRSKFGDEKMLHSIETMTVGFFAPIFFATAGLRVDLGLLADGTVAFWTAVVVAVASLAKFGGSWIGARMAKLSNRESTALSVGLNARGALEIVIATLGLSLGVLNDESYTAIVVMAIATSVLAPPLLRLVLRNWQGTEQEQARLEQEETLRTNQVVRDRRVLLLSEGGSSSIMAAQLVDLAWPEAVDATVLTVTGDEEGLRPVVASFANRNVEIRRVDADAIADAVVEEAKLGYGAIAAGAPSLAPDHLLSPLVDELLGDHDVPMLVVRRGRDIEGHLPWAYGRAVVPVTGTANARAAQEIAFNLSNRLGTEIVLTHVLDLEPAMVGPGDGSAGSRTPGPIAEDLLDSAERFGAKLGARTQRSVRRGTSVAEEICAQVQETESDLVVIGASIRHSGGLFLGHTIEQILDRCDATVAIVLTPPTHSPVQDA